MQQVSIQAVTEHAEENLDEVGAVAEIFQKKALA